MFFNFQASFFKIPVGYRGLEFRSPSPETPRFLQKKKPSWRTGKRSLKIKQWRAFSTNPNPPRTTLTSPKSLSTVIYSVYSGLVSILVLITVVEPVKSFWDLIWRAGEEEEENDSPIEEVRLTVPITDDPTLPVLTFRTWFLGLLSCILLAFVNQFFSFRSNQLWVSSVAAQIVTLPLGKLMAATLPTKKFGFPGTNWSWSFNPGPFNVKEHVLISIFANTGAGGAYATGIITIVKAFYHRQLSVAAAMLLTQTTQVLNDHICFSFSCWIQQWKEGKKKTEIFMI